MSADYTSKELLIIIFAMVVVTIVFATILIVRYDSGCMQMCCNQTINASELIV